MRHTSTYTPSYSRLPESVRTLLSTAELSGAASKTHTSCIFLSASPFTILPHFSANPPLALAPHFRHHRHPQYRSRRPRRLTVGLPDGMCYPVHLRGSLAVLGRCGMSSALCAITTLNSPSVCGNIYDFFFCILTSGLALDLTPPLPASQGILARWVAEPIQHVLLPTSTFIPNAKGYPVLPKGTQVFLQDLMKVPCLSNGLLPLLIEDAEPPHGYSIWDWPALTFAGFRGQVHRLHPLPGEKQPPCQTRQRGKHSRELLARLSRLPPNAFAGGGMRLVTVGERTNFASNLAITRSLR